MTPDGTGGNEHGDLLSVSYNDGTTPTTTFSYDHRGQQTGLVRNGMTTTRQYHDSGIPLGESHSDGELSGIVLTNLLDANLRRSGPTVSGAFSKFVSPTPHILGTSPATALGSMSRLVLVGICAGEDFEGRRQSIGRPRPGPRRLAGAFWRARQRIHRGRLDAP